ncbi:MAG: hypothetical protein FVQ77_14485 [Cytophagales bacterium]|nr:hypothetical protein [Cytophagales bacterium]
MEPIVTLISFTVAFISIIAGIVTIIWFVRDVRRQNSKELKNQSQILLRIDDGQVTIAKILEKITKIAEKIESR